MRKRGRLATGRRLHVWELEETKGKKHWITYADSKVHIIQPSQVIAAVPSKLLNEDRMSAAPGPLHGS